MTPATKSDTLRIQVYANGQATVYAANGRYLGSFDTLASAQTFVAWWGR